MRTIWNPFLNGGLLGLLFLVLFGNDLRAQSVDPLAINASRYRDSVVLAWFPTEPAAWAKAKAAGFEVTRFTLDKAALDLSRGSESIAWAGLPAGRTPTPMAGPEAYLALADSAAFNARRFDGQGYVAALSFMLFDSIFTDGKDAEGDLRQQFAMAAFGFQYVPELVTDLLGVRLQQGGLDTAGVYLYHIQAIAAPELRQEVVVDMERGVFVRYQTYIDLDFSNHPFAGLVPPPIQQFPFQAVGKAFNDSIVLRWALTDYDLLVNSKQLGYRISRSRLASNRVERDPAGNEYTLPIYEKAGEDVIIRPWSEEQLGAYLTLGAGVDSMVYVPAQVLYGLPEADANTTLREAKANLVAFGLQAADHSANAANALGLRYVDYAVEPGENYVYTVELLLDSMKINALPVVSTVALTNEYFGPEPIQGFAAAEDEYVINLILSRENERNYTQYFFEKADLDSDNWTALHQRSVVFEVEEKLTEQVYNFYFPDSVAVLYQPFRYRVRGKNYFQELSPWAELTAMARDRTPPPAPVPGEPLLVLEDLVNISWDGLVSEESPDLAGYYLRMGHYNDPEGLPIVTELIPPGTANYQYQRPGIPFVNDSSYFFQVSAVDTAGNLSSSFAVALSVIDSIPPGAPVGLQGVVDTNGVVTLFWLANTERDLAGYQVYGANDSTATFTQLTEEDLTYNYFRDTLALNALNEAVYYRVSAFDRRYNNSPFSQILRVERPDVIPPTPPLLLLPKPTGEAVVLEWKPSSSTDALAYLILRRPLGDQNAPWEKVDSILATQTTYADTGAVVEQTYQYTLRTIDDAGLKSEPANTQTGRRIFAATVGGVENVTVNLLQAQGNEKARTQVQWKYEKPGMPPLSTAEYRFMVYRAEGDQALTRYKQLRSKEPDYTDAAVEPGKTYRYALMVVYDNGKKSALSAEKTMTIPELKN